MKLKTLTDIEFLNMLKATQKPKLSRADIIDKVIDALRKEKCDPEYVSPNFVADFAYNNGYKNLSSDGSENDSVTFTE